jgi:CBS domain containing-hemolysin-like protein
VDPDSSSLIPLAFVAISLAAYALAVRGEVALAAVERLERFQQAVAPRSPRSPILRLLDQLPMEAALVLSIVKHVAVAAAVVSSASFAVLFWNGNWSAVTVASVAGLALVGGLHLAVVRVSAEADGNGGTGAASPADAFAADLNMAVDNEGEPLEEFEVRMIRGVVELDTTIAREIMVPRVDVEAVEIGSAISDVVDRMIESGHSRLPVYREALDHIEGLVYARDLLKILNDPSDDSTMLTEEMLRAPIFIPETKTLEELLTEFQETRVHIAIVIDEYGGAEGIVTIEDLIEEIVGEIQDEFDSGEPEIEQTAENEYIMDARASLDDLRDRLDVVVEADGFDTVGGLVYQRLGKIPTIGEKVSHDGLTIEVVSTVGRRLKTLKVTAQGDSSEEAEQG